MMMINFWCLLNYYEECVLLVITKPLSGAFVFRFRE